MNFGLEGRVALVAGGGRGVGRSVALSLAREGADVAVLSRTQSELDAVTAEIRALGRKALALQVDLSKAEATASAIDRCQKELGAPTLLVLSAAALWHPQRLHRVEPAEIEAMWATDFGGALTLCQHALPHMVSASFGRIVALSSLAARTGIPGGALYAASKSALEGLMRGIALDYGKSGVTANALCLGFIDTERLQQRTNADPVARAKLESATALKRLLQPEEIGSVVSFLCSTQAGGITGAVLDVTAGSHLSNL